ncbi:hypothetical protein PoB_002404500 [Plakobranchus ocellatus]|uniref:Uncharacterized protein n=1 Tax=Plakobranchus ocellatus TaxID=259542 RepID=A0AAV3ZSG8_9GAST|nr:hypothetical protein PoB_002404500 [Plakobranchus ocellatus]
MVPPPNELCGIPGLGLVPDQEIRRYKLHPKPGSNCFEVLTYRGDQHRKIFGTLPLRQFQIMSLSQGVIFMPQLALPMLERSFSLCNILLSERRRNLSESSLK